MRLNQINWKNIKHTIGRWTAAEAHAGQVYYEITSEEEHSYYATTQFVVDFEDETVSEGWCEWLDGEQYEVPLTPEERAEAEQMIRDVKQEDNDSN